MKFSIKDFFSKCDQIRSFLWIWSHLLKKYFTENFTINPCKGNITVIKKQSIDWLPYDAKISLK